MRRSRDDNDLVPLHQPFERALRGFNRRQVLEHLDTLDRRIAMMAADRDAALTEVAELSKVLNHLRVESELLEHLRREADNAKSQVEHILTTPMAEASARIQSIMRLAEQEAAEIKSRAEVEAAARIARADQDIAELKVRADDQINELRACASRETKSLLDHARRQCAQLETDSAARREAAEQDSAQAIAQRESTTSARIRDSELRSIARVHLILQVIGEQLATRVRVVERDESALRELRTQVVGEVTALETLRAEVAAAVAAAHQFLAEALGQVCGTTDEHAAGRANPVPIQRNAEGGTVHRLNAGAENRRSPRSPR